MFGIPIHDLVVHFPIALAVLAIVSDLRRQHDTGYRLTGWGAVAAAISVLTGMQMGDGRIESAESLQHVASAFLGTLSLILLAVLRYSAMARTEDVQDSYPTGWVLLGLLAALAIAMAAITGHRIAFGN